MSQERLNEMLLKDHPNHLQAYLTAIKNPKWESHIFQKFLYLAELITLEPKAIQLSRTGDRKDGTEETFILYDFPYEAADLNSNALPGDVRLEMTMLSMESLDIVDQQDAAIFCGVDRRTIIRWGDRKRAPLRSIKFGRQRIYDQEWLYAFMVKNRNKPPFTPHSLGFEKIRR